MLSNETWDRPYNEISGACFQSLDWTTENIKMRESIGTADTGDHCKHYLADCDEKQHVVVQVLNKW